MISVMCALLSRDSRTQEDVRGALMTAMRTAAQYGIHTQYLRHTSRYGVVVGRNRCVAALLKSEFTHLLFVDDDVRIDADTIKKLLECESDIAAGCYAILRQDGTQMYPTLSVKRDGEWEKWWFDGAQEADAAGTGCMLIRRDVFSKVGLPGNWFRWPTWLNEDGDFEEASDDVDFCNRAKAAGCSIMAHGNVRCGHSRTVDLSVLLAIHQAEGVL